MTQKEYISQLLNTNIPYETTVGEYVRTIEQRIEELEEPKTCEGCIHYQVVFAPIPCSLCSRGTHDYYEPKDIQ